jgi:polysaccharide deacetylase family protein (PEP-CTERM system associated)
MKNALTIDLEDYYQVSAFAHRVDVAEWDTHASRVEQNTAKILDLLASANRRATFFVLGWVAEKYPRLIRQVADLGHEIACHSLHHRLVYSMTPEEFREDTRRAKELIEDAGQAPVRGYRAPSFSITRDSWWAFDILAELGFTYDSSIFPIKHVNYGMLDVPRHPFRVETRSRPVVEFPMPTLTFGGARAPIGGGAYLRLLPYRYTRWGIRYINRQEHQAACVYLHPWELDPEQPRGYGGLTARARHYFGLRGTESKLRRLLEEIEFCPLGSLIAELNPSDIEIFTFA